jgi:hypothetical protein
VTAARYAWLGDGYPPLIGDVLRNIAKSARRLGEAGDTVITFTRDPAAIAAARYEITAARAARNLAAAPPRPVDLTGLRHALAGATEMATLRVHGQLAAWLLAVPAGRIYRVLAGQMAHRLRGLLPGYGLESIVTARAMAGLPPWPPLPEPVEATLKAVDIIELAGSGYTPHPWIDWGPGHPGKLLTRTHRTGEKP